MGRPKGLRTEVDLFHLWMAAIAFAAFVIGASIQPAGAESTKPVCFSPEFVKKAMSEKLPGPIVIEQTGAKAKDAIDRFNKTVPPTSYVGDYLLLWVVPGRPPLLVVIFNKGCAAVRCIYGTGCKRISKDAVIKPKEISI